jgi:hypothetical protein
MPLTTTRNEVVRKWLMKRLGVAGNMTKPIIRSAIDAAYDWIYDVTAKSGGTSNKAAFKQYLDVNAASFTALASNDQVAILFSAVVLEDANIIDIF